MILTPRHLHYLNDILTSKGIAAYVTGGFIRNTLLKLPVYDVDICGATTPSDMMKLLQDTPVTVVGVAPDFGTVLLCYTFNESPYKIEYTTFRRDSYPSSGAHRPKEVIFTDDMTLDALRRDFTINAMYCPLTGGEIIDPTDGLNDIQQRILRATSSPADEVMNQDGLRIMRLVRQACTMGLTIHSETFDAAKRARGNIRDIAAERIHAEFEKILLADAAYGIEHAHCEGINLLIELGIMDIILPELENGHYLRDCKTLPSGLILRLTMLLQDIGSREDSIEGHELESANLAERRLNALSFPKKTIRQVCLLIKNHTLDLTGDTPENDLRIKFVELGEEAVRGIIALRAANAACFHANTVPAPSRWQELLAQMKHENVPFKLSDLAINGRDIMEQFGLSGKEIGEAMQWLWHKAILTPEINERERLLVELKEWKMES